MHDAEIHNIIVRTIRAKCAGLGIPEQEKIIDDLSIDIMVKLQLGGFQITKRNKNADRT